MIVVVGAGVSGLTVARYLHQGGVALRLFEASSRPGGVIQSVEADAYRIELGPNSLLADAEVRDIVQEIGLGPRVLMPRPVSRHRFIYRGGRYQRLPSDPLRLLFSGFFSIGAKYALFREPFLRATAPAQESVAGFFARRFNQEIVDYAVNPFVAGIYAGDPQRLLMAHTFPSVLGFEQRSGSVIRGALSAGGGGGRKTSFSFDTGMEAITRQLSQDLPMALNTPARALARDPSGWRVVTAAGSVVAEQVVLSVPAHQAASLLAEVAPGAGEILAAVDYPSLCVVHSAYPCGAVAHPLDGFGGLHPRAEGLFTAGSIWSSSLFPQRCPGDQVLFTSFVGGAQYREHVALGDDALLAQVAGELAKLYRINQNPLWQRLTRWDQAIPQYDGAIAPAWELANDLERQGLYICANWRHGVSVADCLKKGRTLARRLMGQ